MSAQEIFLLWIKLPSNRKLMPKEARVITLEYDSPKEDSDKKDKVLEFHLPLSRFFTPYSIQKIMNLIKKNLKYMKMMERN